MAEVLDEQAGKNPSTIFSMPQTLCSGADYGKTCLVVEICLDNSTPCYRSWYHFDTAPMTDAAHALSLCKTKPQSVPSFQL